jgi:aspartyl-tRNA(Asn)/glutamyl-tRNA(Gln) amidotransferase subunit A
LKRAEKVMDSGLHQLTLTDAARLIAQRTVSPDDLVAAATSRIAQLNPEMRAFITVVEPQTFRAARQGLLAGIPVSVKDLYDTKGILTTAGSKIFAGRVPDEDARAVKALKECGAVIIGKANMHEFAYGVTTINPHYGAARNPWDRSRISGGSSGGSASAVALGMGFGSLGSDTGGSIRIPAALCGVVGLKPTYGRVSLRGVVPLAWSFDHAGPIARTVRDAAVLLDAIAGHDPLDPYSRNVQVPRYTDALTGDITGIRIGIPKNHFYERLASPVETALDEAIHSLQKLGAALADIQVPDISIHRAVWLQIASPEAYSFHENRLRTQAALYGADVRGRLEAGRNLLSIDYVRAQRVRTRMKLEFKQLFEAVDVIVTPTVPIPAPRIEDAGKPWGQGPETAAAALTRFTRYFNIVGLPAISIPCGLTPEGLPIGMQIAGRAFDETTVLRVAHAYEQHAGWFERRPPL